MDDDELNGWRGILNCLLLVAVSAAAVWLLMAAFGG